MSLQKGGSRRVLMSSRIEHQPPKLGVEGSNPSSPATVPNFVFDSKLFNEFSVENCVIRCFKWFSKVFEILNPNSFDFETNSLSK